jgi:class 3 adenylate cyclase
MFTISLRTVIFIMTAVVALSAGVIGFLPTYYSGKDSILHAVNLLRRETTQRLANRLLVYFNDPMLGVAGVGAKVANGLVDVSNRSTIVPALAEMSTKFGVPCYVGAVTADFYIVRDNKTVESGLTLNHRAGGVQRFYEVDRAEGYLVRLLSTSPTGYNHFLRPWYAPLAAAQGWSSVYPDSSGDFGSITAGVPLTAQNGSFVGVFAADISTIAILEFLGREKIAKTGEVYLIEAGTRHVLGGNVDNTSVVWYTNAAGAPKRRMATLADVPSPLVAHVVAAVGEEALFRNASGVTLTVGEGANLIGAPTDIIYVDVVRMSDKFNLDLRLLVLIRQSDFLGEHYKNSENLVVIGVTSMVALVALSVILIWLIFRPLSELEKRMYMSANFVDGEGGDDDEDDWDESKVSRFTEVFNIQLAHDMMQAQMTLIKGYLPQSILLNEFDDEGASEAFDADGAEDEYGDPIIAMANPASMKVGRSREDLDDDELSSIGSFDHEPGDRGKTHIAVMPKFIGGTTSTSATPPSAAASPGPHRHGSPGGPHGGHPGAPDHAGPLHDSLMGNSVSVQSTTLDAAGRPARRKSKLVAAATQRWSSMSGSFGLGNSVSSNSMEIRSLNVHTGLAQRFVSVLVVNLRGFHRACADFGAGEAVALQTELLKAAEKVSHAHKGVIDYFYGDHVVVSFNACLPAAGHAVKCATAALQLVGGLKEDLSAYSGYEGCSVGMATGSALVGNIGSVANKRFCTVGPVFNRAMILERLCKGLGVTTLLTRQACRAIEQQLYYRHVDIAKLPGLVAPTAIATVMGVKETAAANEEWMYALQKAEEADAHAARNEVFEAVAAGNLEDATSLNARLPAPTDVGVAARLEKMLEMGRDEYAEALRPALSSSWHV